MKLKKSVVSEKRNFNRSLRKTMRNVKCSLKKSDIKNYFKSLLYLFYFTEYFFKIYSDPCIDFPCEHNGTCQRLNNTNFVCNCNPAVSFGKYCEFCKYIYYFHLL